MLEVLLLYLEVLLRAGRSDDGDEELPIVRATEPAEIVETE